MVTFESFFTCKFVWTPAEDLFYNSRRSSVLTWMTTTMNRNFLKLQRHFRNMMVATLSDIRFSGNSGFSREKGKDLRRVEQWTQISSFFAKFLACFYYVQSFSVPWARMLYTEKSSNMAKKKNNRIGFVLNLFLHGNSKTRNPEGFGFSICRVINLVAMSLLVKVTFSWLIFWDEKITIFFGQALLYVHVSTSIR